MNNIKNLHSTIRRYCIENYSYWTERYSELDTGGTELTGYGYTEEQLKTFPRYNVLNDILIEIERYRSEDFTTLDEAKHFFCLVAADGYKAAKWDIEQKAIDEERDKLCKFINQLTEEDLSSVESLFYRRVLSNDESQKIWSELKSKWKISEHYWYPLSLEKPENVEGFHDAYFENEVGAEKLREILQKRGVEKVWEIREDQIDYELELSIFEPYYNGAEGFWCDSKFDWIIYASHESSVTVGGWLLAEIKDIWSNWEKHTWITPFYN